MNNLEQILNKLPDNIRGPVMDLPQTILNNLEEIRIKAENDIRVLSKNQEIVVALKKNALVTREDLDTILNNLLNYSYYAYENARTGKGLHNHRRRAQSRESAAGPFWTRGKFA